MWPYSALSGKRLSEHVGRRAAWGKTAIRIALRSSLEPGQKGCRHRPHRATVYILSGWSLHRRSKGATWLGLPCRGPPQRSRVMDATGPLPLTDVCKGSKTSPLAHFDISW